MRVKIKTYLKPPRYTNLLEIVDHISNPSGCSLSPNILAAAISRPFTILAGSAWEMSKNKENALVEQMDDEKNGDLNPQTVWLVCYTCLIDMLYLHLFRLGKNSLILLFAPSNRCPGHRNNKGRKQRQPNAPRTFQVPKGTSFPEPLGKDMGWNWLVRFLGNIWVFPKIRVPQSGWFIRENPIKMDDLGVPPFKEKPI